MGRIYYLLGKSATGKDTLYKEILKRRPKLRTVTMYTTRPIREGETDEWNISLPTARSWSGAGFRKGDRVENLSDDRRSVDLLYGG